MNNGKDGRVVGGVGFFGLLQLAFIILKLCGVITWSWVWVLAPIWMEILLIVVIMVGFVLWWDVQHDAKLR